MTDHVCAWAAASPARYRASSSSKAASMSSSIEHDARHDLVVGIDLDDVEHFGVERSGRWSRPEERVRQKARRSPRVAMGVESRP